MLLLASGLSHSFSLYGPPSWKIKYMSFYSRLSRLKERFGKSFCCCCFKPSNLSKPGMVSMSELSFPQRNSGTQNWHLLDILIRQIYQVSLLISQFSADISDEYISNNENVSTKLKRSHYCKHTEHVKFLICTNVVEYCLCLLNDYNSMTWPTQVHIAGIFEALIGH